MLKVKNLSLLLALLAGAPLSAQATEMFLDTLDCQAANGGTTRAVENKNGGAIIRARFGMVQGKYFGKIESLAKNAFSSFALTGLNGERALVIVAVIDPDNHGMQSVAATISFAGSPLETVGAVCQVRVTDYP